MSEKVLCPGCDSYSSSVRAAFEEGRPCPSCKLPASAARQVEAARTRAADEGLVEQYIHAIKRAEEAETRLREAELRLDKVRTALETKLDLDGSWMNM